MPSINPSCYHIAQKIKIGRIEIAGATMANPKPKIPKRKPRAVPPGFITLTEAGARVHLGKTASHRAGKAGQIPYIELGGMRLVKEDWLDTRWAEAEEFAASKRATVAQHRQQEQTQVGRAEISGSISLPGRRLRHTEGKLVDAEAGKCGIVPYCGAGGKKSTEFDP
jgi:hypothetical protein